VRVVLSARVSSEKQVEKDLSIASPLKALRKYAAEGGWEVYKEFVDEAQSVRTANRPSFKEMFSLARRNEKSCLLLKVAPQSDGGANPHLGRF